MENRGRPTEQTEKPETWTLETDDAIWNYDVNKSQNGCYLVEQKNGKGSKRDIVEIDSKPYGKHPVVMVFKTSNRSNAKTKMKVWKTKNVDYIISANSLPGVPDRAVILELAVGRSFIEKYQSLYNL